MKHDIFVVKKEFIFLQKVCVSLVIGRWEICLTYNNIGEKLILRTEFGVDVVKTSRHRKNKRQNIVINS
jgi:hypothetical protein